MQIVGVAGMPGSGRATLVRALAANRRWTAVSLAGLLLTEARTRGLTGTHDELERISAEWRGEAGEDALVLRAIHEFTVNPEPARGRGLVVSNVRRRAEVDAIHARVGRQIWIEATPAARAARAGVEPDAVRVVPASLAEVSRASDFFCENNGTDLVRFRRSAARVLDDDRCCAVEPDWH